MSERNGVDVNRLVRDCVIGDEICREQFLPPEGFGRNPWRNKREKTREINKLNLAFKSAEQLGILRKRPNRRICFAAWRPTYWEVVSLPNNEPSR